MDKKRKEAKIRMKRLREQINKDPVKRAKYLEKIRIRNEGLYARARERQVEIAGRSRPTTCEICGKGGRICFDHDHLTGKFRGWLCVGCNVALGCVEDDIELLGRLISYLESNGESSMTLSLSTFVEELNLDE